MPPTITVRSPTRIIMRTVLGDIKRTIFIFPVVLVLFKRKIHYRILTPIPPSFIKSLNVLLLTTEYPNENVNNGSQCIVQKNAPNAKHRLCIKLMKVAKSYIKQNPCKKRKGKR